MRKKPNIDPKLKAACDYMAFAKGGAKVKPGDVDGLHPLLSRYCRICDRIKAKGDDKLTADAVKLGAELTAFFTAAEYLDRFNTAIIEAGKMVTEAMTAYSEKTTNSKKKKGSK